MAGRVDEWMNGWMDGWLNGRMAGWLDGWMHRKRVKKERKLDAALALMKAQERQLSKSGRRKSECR